MSRPLVAEFAALPDPVARVLTLACALEGAEEVGGANRGKLVERFLATTGNRPGDPWCASFVAYCGLHARGHAWPLPLSASCDVLLAYGKRKALLRDTPQPGDVFLLLKAPTDATHTGFVAAVDPAAGFRTIEGNTNPGGSRDGYGAFRRHRGHPGDVALKRHTYTFLRWHP